MSSYHFKYGFNATQHYFAVFTPTPIQDTEASHLKNKLNGDKVNEEDDPLINNTGKPEICKHVELHFKEIFISLLNILCVILHPIVQLVSTFFL